MTVNINRMDWMDGPRSALVHLSGLADGDGDAASQPVFEHSAGLVLLTLQYNVDGGSVTLKTSSHPGGFVHLAGWGAFKYEKHGGLPLGVGGVLLDTHGFRRNSHFTLSLKLRKLNE